MSEPNKPETEPQEPVEELTTAEQEESQPVPEPLAEDEVNQRIAEIELQMRDVQIRAQAEVQNIQRRAEREVANAHKYALEKFAGGLLEVVDNLERALQTPISEDEAQKAMHEGVALTLKQLLDTLKRHAVEVVDPLGEPFNADLHQAVSMQPSSVSEPNTVTAVLQKGYTLSGRLLRPAMVVVATAS